jgi:hypothetical protein
MRVALLLLCLAFGVWADEAAAVYRLESSRVSQEGAITGHGHAVAVDLSEYGLKGKRYLLTAAHLLSGYEKSWLIVGDETRAVRTVWIDEGLDLAVVRADKELEESVSLGSEDLSAGLALTSVFYPRGEKRKVSRAKVLSAHKLTWMAELEGFGHGGSGSPLFKNGKVTGLALGVFKEGGAELVDRASVMPLRYIRMFLLYESRKE